MATASPTPVYEFVRCRKAPSLDPDPTAPAAGWEKANLAQVALFHKKSGPIRPTTFFRGMWDEHNLYIRFDVLDTCVKVVQTKLHGNVCDDSCAELFIQPAPGPGYFNFEINAAGTMLLYYLEDCRRTGNPKSPFVKFQKISPEWAAQVEIHHSLPGVVRKPILQPIAWAIAYRIPLALFTAYTGECGIAKGDEWRGNLFQCGGSDHWAMWSDIGPKLNYHQPKKFGTFRFV